MIKVAFIKYAGLSSGGTEKTFQDLAIGLSKKIFKVSYFYCDATPYIGSDYLHKDTDLNRKKICQSNNIKLIKFNALAKDIRIPTHDLIKCDFFKIFNKKNFDVVICARAGHSEYPIYLINNIPIIEIKHLHRMHDSHPFIVKTILICSFQKDNFYKTRQVVIPNIIKIPNFKNLDKIFDSKKFKFGFHQRDDDGIFSNIALQAYSKIESKNTLFIILGGSQRYKELADKLKIKNIIFLKYNSDLKYIHTFLNSIDVFCHNRSDGELCSTAIIEALYHSLPIISHEAPNKGHYEQIQNAGFVSKNVNEYAQYMSDLMFNSNLRNNLSLNAKKIYENTYNMDHNINKIEKIIINSISKKFNLLYRLRYSLYLFKILFSNNLRLFIIRCSTLINL